MNIRIDSVKVTRQTFSITNSSTRLGIVAEAVGDVYYDDRPTRGVISTILTKSETDAFRRLLQRIEDRLSKEEIARKSIGLHTWDWDIEQ